MATDNQGCSPGIAGASNGIVRGNNALDLMVLKDFSKVDPKVSHFQFQN